MNDGFWYGVTTGASVVAWAGIILLAVAAMAVRKKDGNDK